jgi:hypothetical protein
MDPLSLGRSCYKQRDYERALAAFTEASFRSFLNRSVILWLDLSNRFLLWWRVFQETHIYYSANMEKC